MNLDNFKKEEFTLNPTSTEYVKHRLLVKSIQIDIKTDGIPLGLDPQGVTENPTYNFFYFTTNCNYMVH